MKTNTTNTAPAFGKRPNHAVSMKDPHDPVTAAWVGCHSAQHAARHNHASKL